MSEEIINVSEEVVEPQETEEETVEVETEGEIGTEEQEPEGEAVVAEQQSKQAPEVDAAFAKMRRELEEARTYQNYFQNEAAKYGLTPSQYLQAVEEQRQKEEAERYATDNNISAEMAQELIKQRNENMQLKQTTAFLNAQTRNIQQKIELKDQPYFKEMEKDIDKLCSENISVDPTTAYNFLLGQRMPALLAQKEKEIEKRVMENLKVKKLGKTQTGSVAPVKSSKTYTSTKQALEDAWAGLET
ncbi:MAG: hypothetical protein PHH57_08015 [Candidatus Omnitrophica bacterium]|nr:hypothetical protein [Candidatus Omnitrophota bacterium]